MFKSKLGVVSTSYNQWYNQWSILQKWSILALLLLVDWKIEWSIEFFSSHLKTGDVFFGFHFGTIHSNVIVDLSAKTASSLPRVLIR